MFIHRIIIGSCLIFGFHYAFFKEFMYLSDYGILSLPALIGFVLMCMVIVLVANEIVDILIKNK